MPEIVDVPQASEECCNRPTATPEASLTIEKEKRPIQDRPHPDSIEGAMERLELTHRVEPEGQHAAGLPKHSVKTLELRRDDTGNLLITAEIDGEGKVWRYDDLEAEVGDHAEDYPPMALDLLQDKKRMFLNAENKSQDMSASTALAPTEPDGYPMWRYTTDSCNKIPMSQLKRWTKCFALIGLKCSVSQEKCEAELLAALKRSEANADEEEKARVIVHKLYEKYALGEDRIDSKVRNDIKACGAKVGEDFLAKWPISQGAKRFAKKCEIDKTKGGGPPIKRSPGLVFSDGTIIEQCWDGERAFYFISEGDAEPKRSDTFQRDDITYTPLVDDLLQKGLVTLPSQPEDYGSVAKLFQDIQSFIKRWVDLPDIDVRIQALWVMMTWLFDLVPQLVINAIRAASESGKTRLAEAIRHISYRGMRSSGTLTFSSLFRTVEKWRGTVLVNEADMKGSDETNKVVKWLNESVDPNGVVWVTNPNTLQVEAYRAFTPVILVSRKSFNDDALESRCIVTVMTETARTDIPLNLPPEFYTEAEKLRNQLLMFRFKNYHRFKNDYTLRYPGIGSRLNQILQPIGSLAKMVSPSMASEVASIAKECQRRLVADRADSEDGQIIRAYFKLEGSETETTSTNIKNEIVRMGNSEMTLNTVGRRLRSLPFDKGSTGSSKPWKVRSAQRDLLIRKYVPGDEADEIKKGRQARIDGGSGQIGQGGQERPGGVEDDHQETTSLDYRVSVVKNLINKRPTTLDDLEKYHPALYSVAKKLHENGEIFTRPDGTMEARR